MAAKKLSPQQQRDRRAKIMLGVLGVVFLAVMGFQLPKLMGGSKSGSSTPPPVATTTAPAAGVPSASGSLAVNVVATPQSGQLSHFSRFAAKDPFHALVVPATATSKSGTSNAAGAGGGGAAPPPAVKPKPTPTTAPPSVTFAIRTTPAATEPAGPMVLAAVLKLNGVRRVIPVGTTFPAANPVFKLVAVGKKALWISLVGGTFGDGHQTLKIATGHPIKLVNTTAGIDYVIRMLKLTTAPKPTAPAAPPATTTSSTTTTGSTTTTAPGQ